MHTPAGKPPQKRSLTFAVNIRRFGLALLPLFALGAASAQAPQPLQIEKVIPLPDIQGRIGHMFFDSASGRLFVTALGDNKLEIVDTRQGTVIHTITGLHEPQDILYLPGPNRIYVTNRGDGSLRIYDGTSYAPVAAVGLDYNADIIRWDDADRKIYIGYGNGAIAAFDEKGAKASEIALEVHPESFRLEAHGRKIFVNIPGSHKIAVLDKGKNSVAAQWKTGGPLENYAMALDETDHRLFIVCRQPATLVVLDSNSGKVVAKLDAPQDCDDIFYDAQTKRIYASGGDGQVSVFQQEDANKYQLAAIIRTRKGARTSLFSPESHSLYVAARRMLSEYAVIYIFAVQ